METELLRIAELAKSNPKMKFTSLAHLLNEQSLIQSHHELPNIRGGSLLKILL